MRNRKKEEEEKRNAQAGDREKKKKMRRVERVRAAIYSARREREVARRGFIALKAAPSNYGAAAAAAGPRKRDR